MCVCVCVRVCECVCGISSVVHRLFRYCFAHLIFLSHERDLGWAGFLTLRLLHCKLSPRMTALP